MEQTKSPAPRLKRRGFLAAVAGASVGSLMSGRAGATGAATPGTVRVAATVSDGALRRPFGITCLNRAIYIADCIGNAIWCIVDGRVASLVAPHLKLIRPMDVAAMPDGRLLVIDAGAGIVWAISVDGRNIERIAGNGSYGFSGDGSEAINAALGEPYRWRGDQRGIGLSSRSRQLSYSESRSGRND